MKHKKELTTGEWVFVAVVVALLVLTFVTLKKPGNDKDYQVPTELLTPQS